MSNFRFSMPLMAVLFWLPALTPANAQEEGGPQSLPPRNAQLQDLLIDKEVVPARVVEIGESGAMRVVSDDGEFELRLLNVLLPRGGSTLGEAAVNLLRERLLAQTIEVHVVARPEDPDLAVGYPEMKGVDVRLELVKKALARYCPGSAPEPELEALEQAARAARMGIWGGVEPELVPACPGADSRGF